MNRKLLKTSTALLLMLSIATTTARADCGSVIKACDNALAAKNKEISLCQLGLTQSLDRSLEQDRTIAERDRQLSSVFRNPFFLLAIGAVAGIIIVK